MNNRKSKNQTFAKKFLYNMDEFTEIYDNVYAFHMHLLLLLVTDPDGYNFKYFPR